MEQLTSGEMTLLIVCVIGATIFFILVTFGIVSFFKRLEKQDKQDLKEDNLPPDEKA